MGNMFALLSGFMFTAITVLIAQHPDPSSISAQFVLFFMAVMLNIFMLYTGSFYSNVVYLCKNIPPYSRKKSPFSILSDVSILLGLGGSTIMLFLLWNLIYLVITQTVVWMLMCIAAYRFILKQFYKRERQSKIDSS